MNPASHTIFKAQNPTPKKTVGNDMRTISPEAKARYREIIRAVMYRFHGRYEPSARTLKDVLGERLPLAST